MGSALLHYYYYYYYHYAGGLFQQVTSKFTPLKEAVLTISLVVTTVMRLEILA